jgi:hypothetical protein
VKNIENGRIL